LQIQQNSLKDKVDGLRAAAEAELENENLTAEEKKAISENLEKEIGKVTEEANKRARAAAVAQRIVASAEAVIQTYLAATKALASGVPPWSYVAMGMTIAAGLANVTKINTTPIPEISAETGGRFIVPDVSPVTRADSSYMRVNPGERIDVTPRGMTGNSGITQYIFKIGEQTIFDIVNKGGRSGDIYVFEPAANL
jgi:5-formyltetrahydrofolate cyclo-ligase